MKNIFGAHGPASRLKSFWIAVGAIVLVVALGTAAFSQMAQQQYFTMDTSNVMGMMPPTPGSMNKHQDNTKINTPSRAQRTLQNGSQGNAVCASGSPVSIAQRKGSQPFAYVAAPANCVWLIKRNGSPWLTVIFNPSSGAYELTDPNGAGALLLKLAVKPGSGSNPVNGNPASSTH